jgi:hypothetical protein
MICLGAAGCSDAGESPAGPTLSTARFEQDARPITVCHRMEPLSISLRVPAPAVAAHLAHGDYIASLYVDPDAEAPSDGVHFASISDALDAARAGRIARGEREAAACRITIDIPAGTYMGSFEPGASASRERLPLLVNVPDITLRGAFRMGLDGTGRATGEHLGDGPGTVLVPDRPIVFLPLSEALILVADNPAGFRGNGAIIEGFAFQSGHSAGSEGGIGILALRVTGLVIQGDRFEHGLTSATDLRASSALLTNTYSEGLGLNCAHCLVGPGRFVASGNRIVDGALGGIYVGSAVAHLPFSLGANAGAEVEPYVLPASASTDVVLINNQIMGHRRLPVGFAVRILGLGVSSAAVPQSTRVALEDNEFTGNTFGLILDAGFPQAGALRKGDLDVTLRHNTISGSCQVNLLVAFTRHTGALGVTTNPYLQNSTFRLDLGGDLAWADAWYSHPGGNGNTLVVDGATIANGQQVAYDPAKVCP